MNAIDSIMQSLQQYDSTLKLLGAIAAPGGIWFWIDKYRSRIRIKVRNFGLVRGDLSGRGISFELENVGNSNTSLEPIFSVSAYTPKRERQRFNFRIEGNERRLSPHDLLSVQGWHNGPENHAILFGWYMTFTLRLTRGRTVRLRVRNANFQQLGWMQFQWERVLFVLFGKLGKDAL